MAVIHVDVVCATEEIYSGEAKCVFAPATMGEIGVYPMHVPLISTLKPGEVRVETENGVESIFVSGGIIEVQPDTVTIFSDTAIRADDLDESKALEAKKRAEEILVQAQKTLQSIQEKLKQVTVNCSRVQKEFILVGRLALDDRGRKIITAQKPDVEAGRLVAVDSSGAFVLIGEVVGGVPLLKSRVPVLAGTPCFVEVPIAVQ